MMERPMAAEPVAVTSRSFSRHPVLRRELLARHPLVTFNDEGRSLMGDELVGFLSGHVKAIVGLEVLDEAVLAAVPTLRVVSKYGVGLDKLDLAAMARRGVRLGWTSGVNRRSVAELVVAFALALLRFLPSAVAETGGGGWRQTTGRQLSGRTIGIIGCGHVGKEVAVMLRSWGCPILANDVLDFPEFYAKHDVTPVSIEALLARADVVTLHVPLDASTRNLLSADRLALLKPDAILINTARGNIVDEPALKTMLTNGRLAGAAFDVFATEPPDDPELLALPSFLATPHIGGTTEEAILAMGRAAIAGLDDARPVADPSS
jgi:phosphoglycerate dehydrogenase-like enzyme